MMNSIRAACLAASITGQRLAGIEATAKINGKQNVGAVGDAVPWYHDLNF